jgi:hypothetical protein
MITTTSHAKLYNENKRLWEAGYKACQHQMKQALMRSGDIDLTECGVCGLPCFVAFDDGLPICHDCETKKPKGTK